MLTILVPKRRLFDETTQRFFEAEAVLLKMEHSLLSIAKWESKWNKSYISTQKKSSDEVLDYFRQMTISPAENKLPPAFFATIPQETVAEIIDYINAPMSATIFYETNGAKSREVITSELIYFWMIQYQIPFECEKWHLNRLLTLIRVCGIKNSPKKKLSRNALLARNAKLNEERKRRLNTTG